MMGGGAAPGGAMQWYYIDAQQNYVGPVDARGLEQLKVHGYVNNDTFVWAECLTGWQRLSVKAGGAARAALGAAQPAAPAPNAGVQKDGVSIPAPIMAEHPGGEWDTSKGMRILIGAERRVRSIIADDGEVKDAVGTTLAYIESNGEIGDGHMTYAGKVHMPANHVVDHVEILVGEYDQGRGYIKDASGSVVAELNKEGVIQDNGGQSIGFIEGFTYHKVPILAAYFLIVDPSYVRSRGVSHVS